MVSEDGGSNVTYLSYEEGHQITRQLVTEIMNVVFQEDSVRLSILRGDPLLKSTESGETCVYVIRHQTHLPVTEICELSWTLKFPAMYGSTHSLSQPPSRSLDTSYPFLVALEGYSNPISFQIRVETGQIRQKLPSLSSPGVLSREVPIYNVRYKFLRQRKLQS